MISNLYIHFLRLSRIHMFKQAILAISAPCTLPTTSLSPFTNLIPILTQISCLKTCQHQLHLVLATTLNYYCLISLVNYQVGQVSCLKRTCRGSVLFSYKTFLVIILVQASSYGFAYLLLDSNCENLNQVSDLMIIVI